MSVRLAACEPCRMSKLACGHERPSCTRCRDRGRGDACTYRSRPFRRRFHVPKSLSEDPVELSPTETAEAIDVATSAHPLATASPVESASNASAQPYRYPNPGYLGISSHSTLFDQVFSGEDGSQFQPDAAQQNNSAPPVDLISNQVIMDRAMHALSRLERMDVSKVTPLVRSWLGRGVNLPLAGPIVSECLWSVENWRELLAPVAGVTGSKAAETASASFVTALLENTLKPLVMSGDLSKDDFLAAMVKRNLRWETLGIFFAAAARAAYDTPYFPPLYATNEQRRRLGQALTYMCDCCLETCLGLDCLNDLQLVLQYENFIVHSQLDGDQSYHSWRKIGDLASSLFALGYNEIIDASNPNVPHFVVELRKACFARIYTADKSLAVFLGRPPRIVKDYCHFQIPSVQDGWINDQTEQHIQSLARGTNGEASRHMEPINYTADTRCTALSARMKEDVLQLLRRKNTMDISNDISQLRKRVEQQWQDLPASFKLTTSVRECQNIPFHRDFLAGTRLDHLHILFLLGIASQTPISEPNDDLLMVATEMLSIVVEVIILRDQLVNSGSCLIWKVAQYGLPAAGVISLGLLKINSSAVLLNSRSKMIQDLSILVAEIKTGAWIQAGEPNFALFSRATRTIETLLDSLLAAKPTTGPGNGSAAAAEEMWEPYVNNQLWDFEMEFWANLAEHPTLLG